MQKKRIVLLGLIFAFIISVCGCTKPLVQLEKGRALPSTGETWSVFVYMCAGGIEEDTVNSVLNEMMDVEYSENVNFIVETGGRNDWSYDGIYSDYIQRFVMQKGSMFLSSQTAENDMALSDTLADFLNWGVKNYSADHYGLVVYGAGGGAMIGAGYDERYDSVLSLEDVSYSLSLTGEQFDMVCFDSSFMSSIETAAALAPHAKYMVASEDIIAPEGIDYRAFANRLIENPSISLADLGKAVCDDYYIKCEKNGKENIATMAVCDLSRVSELTQAFHGMAGMMLVSTDDLSYCSSLMQKLERIETIGAKTSYEGYTDMTDLKNMAETIQMDMGATADVLIRAIDETVLYSVIGKRHSYAKGLGVYYPFSGTRESIEKYCTVFPSHNYLTFARKISINADTLLDISEEDYKSSYAYTQYTDVVPDMTLRTFANTDNRFELNINTDMRIIKEVSLEIHAYMEDLNEYVRVGTGYDIDGELPNSVFTCELPQKTLSINGHNVNAQRIEKGFLQDIYAVRVLLNGEDASIRILHNKENDKYEILGVWQGINTLRGLEKRGFRELKIFDKIAPVFESADATAQGTAFKAGFGGASAGLSKIKGNRAYSYSVEDIYSQVHTTDICIEE